VTSLSGRSWAWAKRNLVPYAPGMLLRRVRPALTRTLRTPSGRPHGAEVPVFGVVGTWMEEDIIYAVVRHVFEQGVDRVFLLDNGSTDRTVDEAIAAGAEHIATFWTPTFDEKLRYDVLNAEIRSLSRASGVDRIWWLVFDADEFVTGPNGTTVREHLASVDERCRVVGARVFDHFPDPDLEYPRRTNPLEVQPLCTEQVDNWCPAGHRKHPAMLWMQGRPEVTMRTGIHQVECTGEPTYEPVVPLVCHHHPYRNRADTAARLDLLAGRASWDHLDARRASFEAVYRRDYEQVLQYRTGQIGVRPRPWSEVRC